MKIALSTPEKSVTATRVLDFTLDKLKFRSILSNTIEFMARVKVIRKLQEVKTPRKFLGVAMNWRQSGLRPNTPNLLLLLFSSGDRSSSTDMSYLLSSISIFNLLSYNKQDENKAGWCWNGPGVKYNPDISSNQSNPAVCRPCL